MQVPGAEYVTHHVREAARLGPGQPALWLGLRTALAIGVPLLLAPLLPAATATWAPLAGYAVALVDKGGAYRERAEIMGTVALGVLLAVAAGTLVAGHAVLAILVVTLGAFACAMAHAFGANRAGIGNAIALHLTVAAFLPTGGSLGESLAGVAGGAGWALFLGVIVWPVRVYKPGRRAIALTLGALAGHARALASAATAALEAEATARATRSSPLVADDLSHNAATQSAAALASARALIALDAAANRTRAASRDAQLARHREIRTSLEAARATLVATRRGRRGESGRGERLLAIAHACDHVFGILIGLEELLAAARGGAEVIARDAERLGAQLAALGDRVLVEERVRRTPPAADAPAAANPRAATTAGVTDADHARLLAGRLEDQCRRLAALVDSLADDSEPTLDVLGEAATTRLADTAAPGLLERLRVHTDLDSAVLRHAVRAAICVAAAAIVASLLHLERGYWITLTTFILLQPHRAATTTRAIQRGVGTVLGAVIAAGVAWAINDPLAIVILVVILAGVGASVSQLNYGLFSVFVTPTFILLAELHTQDFGIVWVRVTYTLLAGTIAFVASAVLWPARESSLFAEELATALRAAARYGDAIRAAAEAGVPPGDPSIIATRRAFGVALDNAELALDRVVADRAPPDVVEPAMAMVSATRRLGGAFGVLASTRALLGDGARATLGTLARSMHARLAELAGAIEARRLPPAPPPPTPLSDAVLAARWARVELHLAAIAQAAARAALQSARPRAQGTGAIPMDVTRTSAPTIRA